VPRPSRIWRLSIAGLRSHDYASFKPFGALGQVGLGQVGLGQVGLGQIGLGQVGLGQVGLGATAGLGLGTSGLSAQNHFGLRHLSLLAAVNRFTAKVGGDAALGFLLIESCESRATRFAVSPAGLADPALGPDPMTKGFRNLPRLYGFYSAEHSLWYRNVDWDVIWGAWQGQGGAATFQRRVIDWAKTIPNYDFQTAG
jgi:hypothetical protein